MESVQEGGDFVGGEGNCVEVEVIFEAKSRAAGGGRNQVAGRVRQGDSEALAHLDEHLVLELGEVSWGDGH